MSTTVRIKGLADENDPKHIKMVKALKACKDADIEIPDELEEYFGGCEDSYPLEIDIDEHIKEVDSDYQQIWEIDLSSLPKSVKKIKVTWG